MNIIIFGSNDIATASANRLFNAGFNVLIISDKINYDLYGHRNYSNVLRLGSKEIFNVKAVSQSYLLENESLDNTDITKFIFYAFYNRMIPVIEYSEFKKIKNNTWKFYIITEQLEQNTLNLIDGKIISIKSLQKNLAADYYVSDSQHYAGRVFYSGSDPDEEQTLLENKKYISSEKEGLFVLDKKIGEKVFRGEKIASISDMDIVSNKDGYINGAVSSGLLIPKNINLIDVNTFFEKELLTKHYAIGGGILETILYNNKL